MALNKVMLIGNLGRDPEVRTFQNGGRVASFSIATSDIWKDKSTGERKEKTEWHRITILNQNLVEVAERYLKKGAKVYVEGQLETRKWTDQEGKERHSTEVVLRPFRCGFSMLDSKGSSSADATSDDSAPAFDPTGEESFPPVDIEELFDRFGTVETKRTAAQSGGRG
jgi:single-strand DNA-binding protein